MTKSRAQHKKLLLSLVDTLTETNCFREIKAKLPGYDSPEIIISTKHGTRISPDVTAINDFIHIFVIETSESLNKKSTVDKWRAVVEYKNLKNGKFWVVVPEPLRQQALVKLLALNIHGGVLGF